MASIALANTSDWVKYIERVARISDPDATIDSIRGAAPVPRRSTNAYGGAHAQNKGKGKGNRDGDADADANEDDWWRLHFYDSTSVASVARNARNADYADYAACVHYEDEAENADFDFVHGLDDTGAFASAWAMNRSTSTSKRDCNFYADSDGDVVIMPQRQKPKQNATTTRNSKQNKQARVQTRACTPDPMARSTDLRAYLLDPKAKTMRPSQPMPMPMQQKQMHLPMRAQAQPPFRRIDPVSFVRSLRHELLQVQCEGLEA